MYGATQSRFFYFLLINLNTIYFQSPRCAEASDQVAGLDVVTWIIAKCSERNVGLLESLQALETTGKCIERLEPEYLKSMSSETLEERVLFGQAAVREMCNSWLDTKKCLKPLVKLLESCFDRKGVFMKGLDISYNEFCLQEAEMEIIEMATQMAETWENCLKKKRDKLLSKYEFCMQGKGDFENYICGDYEFAVGCATTNFDKVCKEMELGSVLRRVFGNLKVRTYVLEDLFRCPSKIEL